MPAMDDPSQFFDYVSLPQTPRSQDDDIVMDKGLQNINVWYAHAATTWMLTSCHPGRCKSYDAAAGPALVVIGGVVQVKTSSFTLMRWRGRSS